MKKIAFIMPSPFTYGGEQRVVSKVANLFNEKGYNTTIICASTPKIDYSIYNLNKNVSIIDASVCNFFSKVVKKINNYLRKINSLTKIFEKNPEIIKKLILTPAHRKKIINIINEKQYDYVVGVGSNYSIFLATYKDKINNHTKIIGWQHNNFEAYFNKKGRRFYGEKTLFKKYCKNFDNYVVLMEDDAIKIKETFNFNCTKLFNPLSFENNKNYSNLKQKNFIWYGRVEYAKGLDLLIEAYDKYKKLGGDWKLQIIGDGSEKQKIIEKANTLKLENDIEFIGFTKKIEKYLKNSTIFLFPSRWEGFGLTLTESMQYGIPCICFDLNPFKEISDGYNSCCFVKQFDTTEFANKMYELSNDKNKIKYMSCEALKNVKEFEGNKIISEWINMLNSDN